jgi:hypothetical protein
VFRFPPLSRPLQSVHPPAILRPGRDPPVR